MKLTNAQLDHFNRQGFVVAEGILEPRDLAPVIEAISGWVERRARELFAQGKLTSPHAGADFAHRYAKLQAEFADAGKGLDIMDSRLRPVFEFLRNRNLMAAVGSIVGPEILCNPIQHLRPKPPAGKTDAQHSFNVPWHQDDGVTWPEADAVEILTVWIPLVDATVANGCMEVLPGVHKLGYLEHQSDGGTTIVPELLPQVTPVPVPVKAGGAVLMHKYCPHRSTDNTTDGVRWSLDLRYQKTGTPTGRPFHPAFVTASAAAPASVCTDYDEWCRKWIAAQESSKNIAWHAKAKPRAQLALAGK